MKGTWCETCKKPVTVSLDSFPALCGECRRPYLDDQMVSWHRRNSLFSSAAELFRALESMTSDPSDCRCTHSGLCNWCLARAVLDKARGKEAKP